MFFLKSCPKCQGDMFLDQDGYGSFIECLQCGTLRNIQVKGAISKPSNPLAAELAGLLASELVAAA